MIKEAFKQIKRIIPIFEVTAISASNQPANDDIQVVSDSTSDTQILTLQGIDNSDVFQSVAITLNGTTAVDSVLTTKWKTFYGAFLGDKYGNISSRAVGTITIKEKSGGATIATIAAGKLSTGSFRFYLGGQNVVLENISGNTFFNTLAQASTTGASGQLTGRMSLETKIPESGTTYVSVISDSSGSTFQIYVLEG
jgi:hypothetical protein